MAVPSSREALLGLQMVIGRERVPFETLLRHPYLPDGYEPVDPTKDERRWLWSDPPPGLVGGYGNPDTYRLADADPAVWLSPAEVLSPRQPDRWSAEAQQSYRRHSVDLTMRGGTTSGVVYPLAVCEIAARFRVRNVGGASAGAIAAAATAAAELGRSAGLPDDAYREPDQASRNAGRVRPGYVGMADTVAWLSQVTHEGVTGTRDEYRLAQLFRAAPADRRVFAVAMALMRRQLWAVPLTVLLAFGKLSKLVIAVLALAGVLATAAVGARLQSWPAVDRPAGGPGWADTQSLGWAALDLGLFFAGIAAVLILIPGFLNQSAAAADPPAWLADLSGVSSQYRQADRHSSMVWRLLISVAVLGGEGVTVALGWWHWMAGALVGSALSALLSVVVALSIWRYLAQARDRNFGLVAGAAPRTRRGPSEWLAGAAKPTVDRALLPWLSDCLNQLAALPDGDVLRFGHLWKGHKFAAQRPRPLRPSTPEKLAAWRTDDALWLKETEEVRALSEDPRHRLVVLC